LNKLIDIAIELISNNNDSADQLNESSIIRKHIDPTVADKLKKAESQALREKILKYDFLLKK